MAEAVENMSLTELRSEVSSSRMRKAYTRAKEKAAAMQLAEKGVAITAALGQGGLEAWKPDLATMMGGLGVLGPSYTGLGLVGLFTLKGTAKEAASGLFLAGVIPLMNKLGAKGVELLTAP
jgi:hypothetical protein